MDVHGFCDDRYAPLRAAFIENFDAGLELGASLAVVERGKPVVDLWAGFADRARTRPWQRDTIVNVFSSTKMATALCTFIAIDRGLLALDAPVARYWPEFAAAGKAHVTVRDVLTYQSGVPGIEPPLPFEAVTDWERMTAAIAASPHWFDGKRVFCYHPTTFGFILGELLLRTDGRRPAAFFREEVAAPLGIDFQIGLGSRDELARVGELLWPATIDEFPDPLYARVFRWSSEVDWTTWPCRQADIPAGNGYGNARSMAAFCAILAGRGETQGRRFLSSALADEIAREQLQADSWYFGHIRLGLAFGLDSDAFKAPSPTSMHWGGAGGSWCVLDVRADVAAAYAPNRMHWALQDVHEEERQTRLWNALGSVLAERDQKLR